MYGKIILIIIIIILFLAVTKTIFADYFKFLFDDVLFCVNRSMFLRTVNRFWVKANNCSRGNIKCCHL